MENNPELRIIYNGREYLFPRILDELEELRHSVVILRRAANIPLSGWQKAEADSETRRAERLFNENCDLKLHLSEIEAKMKVLENQAKGNKVPSYLLNTALQHAKAALEGENAILRKQAGLSVTSVSPAQKLIMQITAENIGLKRTIERIREWDAKEKK